jgi:iron-sulfur cluster assembly protein
MISISYEAAQEVRRLIKQERDNAQEPIGDLSLRVEVVGGGCSGFEYRLGLEEWGGEDGSLQIYDQGVEILVDPYSLPLIEGSQVDWSGGLNGKGFHVNNPLATGSCGCGKSFSAERCG